MESEYLPSLDRGLSRARYRLDQGQVKSGGIGCVGPFLRLLGLIERVRREWGNRRPGELQLWLLLPW